MKPTEILDELIVRYPVLSVCRDDILKAYNLMVACYEGDGIVFTAGNGGSAADASHIVGELMKGFILHRPLPEEEQTALKASGEDGACLASRLQCGLRAVSIMEQDGLSTAVINDLGGELGPAQQLHGLARPGDILLGISTSGNARNIAFACKVARVRGVKIIGLTGRSGGALNRVSDVCIRVPEDETYRVQELHLPVYHALCMMLEARFFTC